MTSTYFSGEDLTQDSFVAFLLEAAAVDEMIDLLENL